MIGHLKRLAEIGFGERRWERGEVEPDAWNADENNCFGADLHPSRINQRDCGSSPVMQILDQYGGESPFG